MGGFGVMDYMIKSFKSNRGLLKGGKKSLKKIYEENNLLYVKKKVQKRIEEFDPEKKRIFLEKFHARQKKARRRKALFLSFLVLIFSALLFLLLV